MRAPVKAALVFGLGTMMALAAIPDARAADLAVTPLKASRVHVVRHRSRIFRDYDGTPVILLRYRPTVPVVIYRPDGAAILVHHHVRTQPVQEQPRPLVYRQAYISRVGYPYFVPVTSPYGPPAVMWR